MGTHVYVFLSHAIPNIGDTEAILALLQRTLPAACAVQDYWRKVGDDAPEETLNNWQLQPSNPQFEANQRLYFGPGYLALRFTPAAALISVGARWRGFLSIPPLRKVYLTVFREIAQALRSHEIAICADNQDEVYDLFRAMGTQADCISSLKSSLGPPQPSVDEIAPGIVARAESAVPSVWYVDKIT